MAAKNGSQSTYSRSILLRQYLEYCRVLGASFWKSSGKLVSVLRTTKIVEGLEINPRRFLKEKGMLSLEKKRLCREAHES